MKNCFVFRAFLHVFLCFLRHCGYLPRHCEPFRVKQSKAAFSLVEMLMALLVASLLLAALAPVMTRKFTDNVNVSGGGAGGYGDISNMECFTSSDVLDFVTYNTDGAYYANFIMASGGGGGAGATSERKTSIITQKIQGTVAGSSVKDIPITDVMTDVKISLLVGGGGGGGRGETAKSESKASKTFTPSAQNCADYGTVHSSDKTDTVGNSGANFAAYDSKGLCVTKFNQKAAVSTCWDNYTYKTPLSSYCTESSSNYPYTYTGCYRTTCIKNSGATACSNLATSTGDSWRLPTPDELASWNSSAIWKALALCDSSSGANVSLCKTSSSTYKSPEACSDGTPNCKYGHGPFALWSSTSKVRYALINGVMTRKSASNYTPSSIRCVLSSFTRDVTTYSYSAHGGGGGGSAGLLSNIDITQYVKQAQNTGGGIIRMTVGGGGLGASTTTNAKSGENSYVHIYDKNNKLIYAWASYGGSAGSNASTASYGAGGGTSGCLYHNGTGGWVSTVCSANGASGSRGSSNSSSTNTSYLVASGGIGANSSYNNTGSGTVGSPSTGGQAGSYGAGGGGGGARSDSTGQTKYGGGNGSGGVVEVTYYEKYPGAGGGGGGGGSIAYIKNIPVNSISGTCNFVIGKGGKGGNIDKDGTDGGKTSVVCSYDTSKTYEVTGGGGGKKGVAALSATANPTGGTAGAAGSVNANINSLKSSTKTVKTGSAGTAGNKNIGGRGGESASGTKGGCGGLYTETDSKKGLCTVNATDAKRAIGEGFTYEDIVEPSASAVLNKTFGTAGAGGGGGAYDKTLGTPSAKGGDGLGGYVCVYLSGE